MKHILFISVLLLMFCTSVSAQRFPYPPGGGSGTGSWLANGTYSIGWPDTTGVKIDNAGKVYATRLIALDSLTSRVTLAAMLESGSTSRATVLIGREGDNVGSFNFYSNAYGNVNLRRKVTLESQRGMAFQTGSAYEFAWLTTVNNIASGKLMTLTGRGKLGVGIDYPENSLEVNGNVKMPKDSTLDAGIVKTPMVYTEAVYDTTTVLSPSGQPLAAIVTVGAGDSVTVTITGVLPTDAISVSYIGGTTAPTKIPWSNVYAANTLTLYGDATRKISYIRIRK